MEKYKELFSKLEILEPKKGLRKEILMKIDKKEAQILKIKNFVFGGSATVSFVLTPYLLMLLFKDLKTSGFWQYLSLIFSDGAASSYLKEILFSLVETLPALTLAISLAFLSLFIWSISKIKYKRHEFQF